MKPDPTRPRKIHGVPSRTGIVLRSDAMSCTFVLALLTFSLWPLTGSAQAQGTVSPPSPAQRISPSKGQAASAARTVPPNRCQTSINLDDTKVDLSGLGGGIYSTGLEPVWVRIISQKHHRPPDNLVPNFSQIYLLTTNDSAMYLGSNYQDKFLRLGKQPFGEIRIMIRCEANKSPLETGPASRNADNLPHATVKQLETGVVEVRFEDIPGLTEGRFMSGTIEERKYAHNHHFHDVVLEFRGGVTADTGLLTLLTLLKNADAQTRQGAEMALKQAYPRIARAVGVR